MAGVVHDPVRFGILGVGRIVQKAFLPALRASTHAVLAAAASRDLGNARATGATKAYGSYDALLADLDVEAVYIATHNGLHKPLTLAALTAGKHVLCEKPLGIDARDCEEMVAAAERARRHLVEGFMYRHHPWVAKAVELTRAGALGEVTTVEASFSFPLTKVDDVRREKTWGGGALHDVGCYCVNFCRLILGDEPRRVQAHATFHPTHDVDWSLHGLLDYGGGRHGVISCGFDGGLRDRVLIGGTRGTLAAPRAFTAWKTSCELVLDREAIVERFPFPPIDVYRREIEDLARAIRGGGAPLLPPDEGLKNARIMDALLAAARRNG